MAYQVIARKYRPQRFQDVVGQEHVSTTLTNAIAQNRVAHAYLFCGPRGTGKTTLARIFAKCLNCTGGPSVDFAEDDPRCVEIAEGRSLDVLEIDGASNNGVEQVRDLRDTCRYAPAASKFKIYIIDEVHMLTTAAFNALLKTLEEPPAHVKFMFATTDPEKVLPTILSRCQRFDLRRIPTDLIVRHLRHVAELEAVTVSEPALFAIARGADGGMRDAESSLDQLISFCGSTIEEPDVLAMFGLTGRAQLAALFDAVLGSDPALALRFLDELCRHGKDPARLMADLLDHGRNLLVFLSSKGNLDLLQVSEAEIELLRGQSARTNIAELSRILEVLADYEGRLREATSRRILFEVALLKAMEARQSFGIDEVLRQLQQLRAGTASAPPAPPARAAAAAPAPRPSPAPPPAPPAAPGPPAAARETAPVLIAADDLPALWTALVDAVGRNSRFLQSYLVSAHPVSCDGRTLVVGFGPDHVEQLDLVNNERNRTTLQERLAELGRPGLQVRFAKTAASAAPAPAPTVVRPEPQAPAPTPAKPVPEPKPTAAKPKPEPIQVNVAEFKDDPLIRKALEIFKGQIVQASN